MQTEGRPVEVVLLDHAQGTTGAGKQITVARPFVRTSYAPMKYDYMAGYICMFILGLFGLGLTFQFQKLERKGVIRKRGMKEAQRS